ncbi:hypothetical protein ACQKJC_22855 [Priestia koreensis]|uniref:hypothetical protein n=1 Tax=Priestia koreensis TaxID=284581 RepID=UPI003D07403F
MDTPNLTAMALSVSPNLTVYVDALELSRSGCRSAGRSKFRWKVRAAKTGSFNCVNSFAV